MSGTTPRVPESEWEWYGYAAHLCVGQWCRFHLATRVGRWIVSTVGGYIPPAGRGGGERAEYEWYAENAPGYDIGHQRKFETMVFEVGEPCDADGCNCGMRMPVSGHNHDSDGYNTAAEAHAGHLAMCHKWAELADVPAPDGVDL